MMPVDFAFWDGTQPIAVDLGGARNDAGVVVCRVGPDVLGGDPLVMATVGDDYQPYAYRMEKLRLSQAHVRRVPGTFTAQAFITTDLDDNQITAFHPGAMNFSHQNHIADAPDVDTDTARAEAPVSNEPRNDGWTGGITNP